MDMIIDFPGGAWVDAHFDGFTVHTDQPPSAGGEGTAPAPFALFLASLGTCAGIYVLNFCRQRNLPVEGIRLVQRRRVNPATRMVDKIDIEIQVPPSFPERYYDALVKSANLCAVKKHIETPPAFEVYTRVVDAGG